MFHIVLYQPEIPPNTGNIIRLCANTGCNLHLIKPLGFRLDEKSLQRAGMDYRQLAAVQQYSQLEDFINTIQPNNLYPVSTKGQCRYTDRQYQNGDAFLFGPETRGLPDSILNRYQPEQILRIPMTGQSRSLNLANAVAVISYEAWRQLKFE